MSDLHRTDQLTEVDISGLAHAEQAMAAALAALPSRRRRGDMALSRVSEHLDHHGGFVTWSGGQDSTVVVDLANRARPGVPVIWYDSGLEFPETHTYIRQLADQLNLNLHIIPAEPDALTVLTQTGSWDHAAAHQPGTSLHQALITGPAALAHTRFGMGELTGLRAAESAGRRILLGRGDGFYTRVDGTQVLAPIWAWSGMDVLGYLAERGLPRNPVYARLISVGAPERARRVGLVVDGNNPENGRYTYLRAGWPELWTRLTDALPRLNEWR
jgi:phosphoadenosine phosphosulfate reductase